MFIILLMENGKQLDYYYNFENYKVVIVYKKMRNIIYRYNHDTHTFKISAPFRASDKKIIKYLEKFAPKLIKKGESIKSPVNGNCVFVFGKEYPIVIGDKNIFEENQIKLKKLSDLNKLLKNILLNYLFERVVYYEKLIGTKHYKISVRNMHTRHGSNSRNNRHLTFALSLVHYIKPIIDSVIIHELVHDIYFDHSPAFYKLLYSFCPEYRMYKKALDNTRYNYGISEQE